MCAKTPRHKRIGNSVDRIKREAAAASRKGGDFATIFETLPTLLPLFSRGARREYQVSSRTEKGSFSRPLLFSRRERTKSRSWRSWPRIIIIRVACSYLWITREKMGNLRVYKDCRNCLLNILNYARLRHDGEFGPSSPQQWSWVPYQWYGVKTAHCARSQSPGKLLTKRRNKEFWPGKIAKAK